MASLSLSTLHSYIFIVLVYKGLGSILLPSCVPSNDMVPWWLPSNMSTPCYIWEESRASFNLSLFLTDEV